ncbi:MAG: histidine kinase [Ginsengibacter sp.]
MTSFASGKPKWLELNNKVFSATIVRDRYLRLLSIPILGVAIPYLSGIITYQFYSDSQLFTAHIYFIFIAWCIWNSSVWLHLRLRTLLKPYKNFFTGITSACVINALAGESISYVLTLAWYKISKEPFQWNPLLLSTFLCGFAVIVFTLIYEILYLDKEQHADTKILKKLNWERSKAEMAVLKNGLEPQFIFDSLNTLSWIILNDPGTAQTFNNKLASVYKYFLINKERELITLQAELDFIENYCFVLQARHDNKFHLTTELSNNHEGTIIMLPYALQILVENAIKHNEFTDADPLNIHIVLNGEYLLVKNNKRPKPYIINSTGTGLRNLNARYKLVCNKNILIEATGNEFIVKLPLIKSNL